MERRVEIACPVMDAGAREKIRRLLEALSLDTQKARRMQSDGAYAYISGGGAMVDSQAVLMRLAEKKAEERVTGSAGQKKTGLASRIKALLHKK